LGKLGGHGRPLTAQIEAGGQVLAIRRSFPESPQKALRGLEVGSAGFESKVDYTSEEGAARVRRELATPGAERIWYVGDAFRMGMSVDEVFKTAAIDPWALVQIKELVDIEQSLRGKSLTDLDA